MVNTDIITGHQIQQAQETLQSYVHKTPVMTSHSLSQEAGCTLFFKCENFQKTGSFKPRGAMHSALNLSPQQRAKGLATFSSGNHAQALAWVGKILKVNTYLVMPKTAPTVKKKGVRAFGGQIFECEPTIEARQEKLNQVVDETKAEVIHPFDHYPTISGQATVAKEIFDDMDNTEPLDYLIVPVGGGGLISGAALAARFFSPHTQVVGAEPLGADDAFRSMQSGSIQPLAQAKTIADGLHATLGEKTFPIIHQHVNKIITITEEAILKAMQIIFERLKIVVEPSGATSLAVVLENPEQFYKKRVGLVLSGGNVDWMWPKTSIS